MKKRIISILFAAIVGFSLSATAVAAELENESAKTSAETNTESSSNVESESNTESSTNVESGSNIESTSEDNAGAETSDDSDSENNSNDDNSKKDSEDNSSKEELESLDESIDDSYETVIVEETETSCTEICHINISYEQEYYVIENLCPTGEVETMNLEAEFSVEKENELQIDLDEVSPAIEYIIEEVDELSGEIENSYEISAKISAEGKVTINSVSASEAEDVSCEVIFITPNFI